MLGAKLCLRTISGMGFLADQSNVESRIAYPVGCFKSSSLRLGNTRWFRSRSVFICCKSSRSFDSKSNDGGESDDEDYLEAIIMVSETARHHEMRSRVSQRKTNMHSSSYSSNSSGQRNESRADTSLGLDFLHRFQGPSIFLKISCDGDFLLPISVGDLAVEKLIDSSREDKDDDWPNYYQFVRNLVEKLDYNVSMVRITKRVINTYFARIYFCKNGEKNILSIDVRPSDAINIAKRCNAPIYVNRHVVATDAIKIVHGMYRMREAKTVYDVTLDSAAEGPDLLTEELDLIKNLNLAVKEERYQDAAMLRAKLMKYIVSND
ncbi:bifunctional nuclease 2 [Impatiens glandulifera]|uniref:bifunctional nuclease 2 n=1 Tax=Impatiens glandulifera TaxID=253017 RepID=UPI001FB06E6E|nr:bifunctional nuclease 2 [Impatiens glandulifera]XP_047317188.1 bifunctional nuclease 2 [Impatiens glandulifera]